ncbi:hypothetical protein AGMMS50212_08590 [Spirochaetia bacterium]|nr:hypothetical protein AGMMS50212_08590 [Spirochaetia bacterium]
MSLALAKDQQHYTYGNFPYWELEEGDLAELIDGELMFINAPSAKHQKTSYRLLLEIGRCLAGKTGEVMHAPFDVRLFPKADNSDDTVVMPDISVILDTDKLSDNKACKGAPDWIIEILSPTNCSHDSVAKFNQYLKAGVREYWIVDPEAKTVQVHILDNGRYVTSAFDETQNVPVTVLSGWEIALKTVFEE